VIIPVRNIYPVESLFANQNDIAPDRRTRHLCVPWITSYDLEYRPEGSAGMIRHRPWIVPVGCAAIAIALLWFYLSKSRPDESAKKAAEDEVYEAVVRAMVTPTNGQATTNQLVFDDAVLVGFINGGDAKSCKESVRKQLRFDDTPPFNTLADKVYRVLARGGYDDSPRSDTIQDFIEKSCTKGPLSRTFHTDFPRVFIDHNSVFFDIVPIDRSGLKDFRQTFPKAAGIISLSHVGFDSSLHQAMVSSWFDCGFLCGTGRLYILRKTRGRWEVVSISITWVT
jgi:hypothetical protein